MKMVRKKKDRWATAARPRARGTLMKNTQRQSA